MAKIAKIRLYDFTTSLFRNAAPIKVQKSESAPPPSGSTTTSVTQRGITFTFDQAYPLFQFASGEWGIAPLAAGGSVTITAVTPDAVVDTAGRANNGLMVDPTSSTQGLDSKVTDYSATLNLALPLTVTPTTKAVSVLKATSRSFSGDEPRISDLVVLTVVPSVPADGAGGAGTFRPPYMAGDKRLLTTAAVRTDLLPSLTAAGTSGPTLADIVEKFEAVQFDPKGNWQNRYHHPARAYSPYGSTFSTTYNYNAYAAGQYADAALRLMMNDPLSDKLPALYRFLQACLDFYGCTKAGIRWGADGGHGSGRKVMVTFGAVLFNDADMKAQAGVTDTGAFGENRHIYRSTVTNMALFGLTGTADAYETARLGGSGKTDIRDPEQVVDGGSRPGERYQAINNRPFIGSALVALLLPGGKAVWARDDFFEYADRWMDHGTWTDDRALNGTALNRTWIDSDGVAKTGAAYHGRKSTSSHASNYSREVWAAHRASALPTFPTYTKRAP